MNKEDNMARTADKIVKEQLGSLLAEVAFLTAMKEELEDKLAAVTTELASLKESKPAELEVA